MATSLTRNARLGQLGGSKFPKLNVLRKDPIASAITSKLVREPGNHRGQKKFRDAPPSESLVRTVSEKTTQSIHDAQNIFQLLPDTELAMQILVSSILSPKDMLTVDLGYSVDNEAMESEVSGALIEIVRKHFEKTYKIHSLLPTILEDCLFKKGSYPMLVLPESSLDNVINSDARVSLESLRGELGPQGRPIRSIGLLGGARKRKDPWSMENFIGGPTTVPEEECSIAFSSKLKDKLPGDVLVSDNLNSLKFPKVIERMREERIQDTFGAAGLGMESRRRSKNKKKVSDDEFADKLYPHRTYERKPYVSLKTTAQLDRPTEGHPLIMKLPPEAIIPVHVPSNPEDHIGYFLLLDQFGHPISRVEEADYYKELSANIESSDITSRLMEAGRRATEGYSTNAKGATEAEAVRLYAGVVERDLVARLKNGVYGEGVEVSRPLDVYRIMLARSLASRGTQIVYVPAELVSYFAFDYNGHGVGKSLLEDAKILASIRSMLMFSNTMAAIKNSTGKTSVGIELDPEDPDPSSTVEYMVHEYAKNRQATYPIGASNPLDIVDFLQNAGIDVQVSGNPRYPETRLNVEDHNSNKAMVDRDLEEDIKARFFMALGLSPETIDATRDIEFATSVVSSNLLLAKRVMLYQPVLLGHLVEHVVRVVSNSSVIWGELVDSVSGNRSNMSTENKKLEPEALVEKFLENLKLTLPQPDNAKVENQLDAYRLYTDFLEQAVDAYFGEDAFMLEGFDDYERDMRPVRAAVIAYYQREWLSNNNVLPEVQSMILQDERGNPQLDLNEMHGNHLELVGKAVSELAIRMSKDQAKREEKAEKQAAMDGEPDDNPQPTNDLTPSEEPEEEEPPEPEDEEPEDPEPTEDDTSEDT